MRLCELNEVGTWQNVLLFLYPQVVPRVSGRMRKEAEVQGCGGGESQPFARVCLLT